jgi:hypothetical protein
MAEWQSRPLDSVYPVIFIDAVNVKICDGNVANRSIYLALDVTVEGTRDILGLWAGEHGDGELLDKPARSRRYHVPPQAARTIAALLTLRDQVIAPVLAAVRSPRMGRKPAHWTRVDRDYDRIRTDMQTLFNDLAIDTPLAA